MKHAACRLVALLFAVIFAAQLALLAQLAAAQDDSDDRRPSKNVPLDQRPRDEFGVLPEDGGDKDLALPDPVLDRTWPGPRPGDKAPELIVPDEGRGDPFEDDKPLPPVRKPPSGFAPPPPPLEPKPAKPLVAPDGRLDAGSPAPAPDPAEPDVLGRDVPEPSEIEEEENLPSPLDETEDELGEDNGYDDSGYDPNE